MAILEEKAIEVSKRKSILLMSGAIAFVAAGIWMLSVDAETIEGPTLFDIPAFIYGAAILSIVFFGLCGLLCARNLLHGFRGVMLGSEGFTDKSGGLSAGFVPWSEVIRIGQYELQKQKFVTIHVRNPEKFVENGNFLQRRAKQVNIKWCGTPIVISTVSLKTSHEELMSDFERYLANYRGIA